VLCLHRLSPGNGFQRRIFLSFRVPRLQSSLAGARLTLTLHGRNPWPFSPRRVRLLLPADYSELTQSKSKSKPRYDRPSVGQSVSVSSPIWGPRPNFCYCQTVEVLLMLDALSHERKGLSFTAVKISSTNHLYLQFYMSAFYIVICEGFGSLWIPAIYSFTCNSYLQYLQGLCQSSQVKVKVKVTLRLAVYRQSVRLGVKPLETHDQIFFFD
jgi:hypothetical protein